MLQFLMAIYNTFLYSQLDYVSTEIKDLEENIIPTNIQWQEKVCEPFGISWFSK